MTPVHRAIIDHVRQHSVDDTLLAMTDQQLLYYMFTNHRSMRLTHYGVVVMQNFFTAYAMPMPKDERIRPKHLLTLDRETLPYYFNRERVVVFDYELGVKLRLAGGRLSTLLDNEAG